MRSVLGSGCPLNLILKLISKLWKIARSDKFTDVTLASEDDVCSESHRRALSCKSSFISTRCENMIITMSRSWSRGWRKMKSLEEELEPDISLEPGGHNRVSLGQENEVKVMKRKSWNQILPWNLVGTGCP